MQTKHFPDMSVEAVDVLSKHGANVMAAVDAMVTHLEEGDDEQLVAKINWVQP